MEINLNQNSITTRLYKWFYSKNTLPQNLCPYFWQVVLMYIFIIPTAPLILLHDVVTKDEKEITYVKIIVGLVLLIGCYGIFCMIASLFVLFNRYVLKIEPNSYFLSVALLGSALNLTLLVFLFCSAFVNFIQKRTNRFDSKPKQSNLITSFIKAKYNKYCPQINWN